MSYKGTPLFSQIIWLEQRVEQLTSGPGGIMEMKQTIADKESRIEKLEVVLRTYACNCGLERDWLCEDRETSSECGWRANKALEGKDD